MRSDSCRHLLGMRLVSVANDRNKETQVCSCRFATRALRISPIEIHTFGRRHHTQDARSSRCGSRLPTEAKTREDRLKKGRLKPTDMLGGDLDLSACQCRKLIRRGNEFGVALGHAGVDALAIYCDEATVHPHEKARCRAIGRNNQTCCWAAGISG